MIEKNLGGWSPVGLGAALAPGGVLRVVSEGRDIAVWRGEDGKTRAWENRCPHRGMRLSYGFVRGNRLTCLYHGWGYDGDGACVSIPAHPTLTPPKTIKVARYVCAEAAGLIWVAAEGANDLLDAPDGDWLPVQTIDLALSLNDARIAIADARSDIDRSYDGASFGDGARDPALAIPDSGSIEDRPIIVFEDARRGRKVLCALQAVAADRTALHILVADGPTSDGAGDRAAMLRTYARWGRDIRRMSGAERQPHCSERSAHPASPTLSSAGPQPAAQ